MEAYRLYRGLLWGTQFSITFRQTRPSLLSTLPPALTRLYGTAQPRPSEEGRKSSTEGSDTSQQDGQSASNESKASSSSSTSNQMEKAFWDAMKASQDVAAEMARKLGIKGEEGKDKSEGGTNENTAKDEASSSSEDVNSSANILQQLRSEVAKAVLPEWEAPSVMRKRTDVNARDIPVGVGSSELVVQEVPVSWLERLKERLGNTALGRRISSLQESEAAKAVADGYASVRERIEAGDSEVANRVSEFGERFMSESEASVALREIRMRHPSFDMPSFLHAVRRDVPVVIKAYLEGSEDILKEYCSDAMLERFVGIYKATVAQGQIADPTILEYSDVDMVDIKMLDNDPVVILHFNVQQINCVRDSYGNVVSGSPEEVNRVYYYWALQMEGNGMVTEDGEYIPPRWKLTEMLLRGMHHLL